MAVDVLGEQKVYFYMLAKNIEKITDFIHIYINENSLEP